MRIINKSYQTVITLLLCLFAAGVVFQSCKEDEKFRLDAFGPSKVERCGEIEFRGKGLSQVEKIYLPADDYDERWAIDKSQFISQSDGKITVKIDCDYPFYQSGFVKVIYGGNEYTTTTRFMVMSDISVISVTALGKIYKEEILEPGTEITVWGRSLKLVDSVVFDNGVGVAKKDFIYRDENGDDNKYITFKLPVEIPSGSIFSLKVPADAGYTGGVSKEVCEVFLPVPDAGNFVSVDESPIRVCSGVKFSVERLDRLEYDKETGAMIVQINNADLPATLDVATKTVTVDLPRNTAGGELPVALYSYGKLINIGKSFIVQTFEFENYDPEIIAASGGVTFYVSGLNLCAVNEMSYETTTMSQGEYVMSPPYSVEGANPRINMDGDRLRLNFLSNYHRGGKIIFTLHDGTKIELPVLGYVGM